ncbi:hypothetical protein GCM10011391_23820 [Pullulanibacillus camelliae]|uniref:Uncharacterized protein n=1 Tax=Pullulanibacillus camelliae TaxID=1707096 RepID=A0A8J2YI68_9BACL|nr:hypothetical protein GCM10011391_23820 [Pullulanibacillus camelliae]
MHFLIAVIYSLLACLAVLKSLRRYFVIWSIYKEPSPLHSKGSREFPASFYMAYFFKSLIEFTSFMYLGTTNPSLVPFKLTPSFST